MCIYICINQSINQSYQSVIYIYHLSMKKSYLSVLENYHSWYGNILNVMSCAPIYTLGFLG